MSNSGQKLARVRIQQLAGLKPNWDCFGSAPPNELAVNNALLALGHLEELKLIPSRINPSCDEGILFELEHGNERILLDFYNSGEIVMLRKSPKGRIVREISADQLELAI
jgi:hypothetical protein